MLPGKATGRVPLSLQYNALDGVGLYFGTPEAPTLTTVPIKSAAFSVTNIRKDVAEGAAEEVRLPVSDAYFLMLYLDDTDHADIDADGACGPVRRYARGSICLVDLAEGAAISLRSRLNSLAFVLPKALFEEAAALSAGGRTRRLTCRRGKPDAVLGNLGTALIALIGGGRAAAPPALLRHMAVAICAHLLHQYGETPEEPAMPVPEADIPPLADEDEPPLSLIAAGAGLAADQFLQEFKRATGLTPYQWLIWMRVERAKEFLAEHELTVGAIAGRCGFAGLDQFNTLFAAQTGMTPQAWRLRRLN